MARESTQRPSRATPAPLPQRLLDGYDRKATDELVETLTASLAALQGERDALAAEAAALRQRCAELEAEGQEFRSRSQHCELHHSPHGPHAASGGAGLRPPQGQDQSRSKDGGTPCAIPGGRAFRSASKVARYADAVGQGQKCGGNRGLTNGARILAICEARQARSRKGDAGPIFEPSSSRMRF